MKTVRKALLATAVATALSPAAVMADTTLYGNFDVSIGIESGSDEALAVEGSPSADNVIGIKGELDLENGNSVTYLYAINANVDGDQPGLNTVYESYVGYKWDSLEVRAGTQDLPLRLAMDKADLFMGTYADFSNIINPTNSRATDSVMVLGGNDTIKYAVSADFSNENASPAVGAPIPETGNRYGAMADVAINENASVAVGIENDSDNYQAVGVSANIGLSDQLTLNVAIDTWESDVTGNRSERTDLYIGGAFALSDMTTLKLALGQADGKNAAGVSATDEATMIALGADFKMSDNVTTYVLYAMGEDKSGVATANVLHTVEQDAQGEGSVLAGGIKLSF